MRILTSTLVSTLVSTLTSTLVSTFVSTLVKTLTRTLVNKVQTGTLGYDGMVLLGVPPPFHMLEWKPEERRAIVKGNVRGVQLRILLGDSLSHALA